MEALIYHFKQVMGEATCRWARCTTVCEVNGEPVSPGGDGGRTPARLHPPTLLHTLGLPGNDRGRHALSDTIPTMSSMNVIAGELDA